MHSEQKILVCSRFIMSLEKKLNAAENTLLQTSVIHSFSTSSLKVSSCPSPMGNYNSIRQSLAYISTLLLEIFNSFLMVSSIILKNGCDRDNSYLSGDSSILYKRLAPSIPVFLDVMLFLESLGENLLSLRNLVLIYLVLKNC